MKLLNNILLLVLIITFFNGIDYVRADCSMLKDCNGHGTCNNATSVCNCNDGYGSTTDISSYKAPDCSARSCPAGRAWADLPSAANTAHALAECSNRGVCNHATGECDCWPGFTGSNCARTRCPNDCSGHGVCLNMKQLARRSDALPLNANTYYEGSEDTTTWDEARIFGCVCDSAWTVGLASGETQEPEWFGADCSQRHCPTGNNPKTAVDETDCGGVAAAGSTAVGAAGNKCHRDCSDLGKCDYQTGKCHCFTGYFGNNCINSDYTAIYSAVNP